MKLLSSHPTHRHILGGLILLIIDGLFFATTNPNRVASSILIIGFILVAVTIYVALRLITAAASFYGLPLAVHGRRLSLLLGVSSAIAVALQSLGELTPRDVVVLVLLSAIAYVYISYGRGDHRH